MALSISQNYMMKDRWSSAADNQFLISILAERLKSDPDDLFDESIRPEGFSLYFLAPSHHARCRLLRPPARYESRKV